MKKINKDIVIIIVLLLISCNGSKMQQMKRMKNAMDREIERIQNLTNEERNEVKKICVIGFKRLMDVTPNEERRCNFFYCYEGKEAWRYELRYCLLTYNEANEHIPKKTRGELLKLTMEEREKSIKESCNREFKYMKEFFPTEEEYCRYFKCDMGKENLEDIITNSCIEKMEDFLK